MSRKDVKMKRGIFLDRDEEQGHGPETITFHSPPMGKYQIVRPLYRACVRAPLVHLSYIIFKEAQVPGGGVEVVHKYDGQPINKGLDLANEAQVSVFLGNNVILCQLADAWHDGAPIRNKARRNRPPLRTW